MFDGYLGAGDNAITKEWALQWVGTCSTRQSRTLVSLWTKSSSMCPFDLHTSFTCDLMFFSCGQKTGGSFFTLEYLECLCSVWSA